MLTLGVLPLNWVRCTLWHGIAWGKSWHRGLLIRQLEFGTLSHMDMYVFPITLYLLERKDMELISTCIKIVWMILMTKWNVFGEQSKAKDMELKGHTDSVDQLCWDPKHGDLLATASGDKTVRLWDARSEYSWLMCFPSLLFPGCISQRIISLLQTTTFKWFLFQLYSLLSNYNVTERSFSSPVLYVSFQGSARHRKKIQLWWDYEDGIWLISRVQC